MKRIALVLFLLSVAACSGDSSSGVASLDDVSATTTATDVTEQQTDEEAVLGFTQCMREEGVDLPDPRVDADGNLNLSLGQAAAAIIGIDQEVIDAAFLECVTFLEGVSFGFDAADTAVFEDRLVRFAGCMREEGIDMPDPDFSAVGNEDVNQGPFGELDLDDPDFQNALDVCGDVLAGIGEE